MTVAELQAKLALLVADDPTVAALPVARWPLFGRSDRLPDMLGDDVEVVDERGPVDGFAGRLPATPRCVVLG